MSGKKGMTHYAPTVKREAVRLYLAEGKSVSEIGEALQLREAQRIRVWVRQYRREGEAGLRKPKGRPRHDASPTAELERLRLENLLLKKVQAELRQLMHGKRNIG